MSDFPTVILTVSHYSLFKYAQVIYDKIKDDVPCRLIFKENLTDTLEEEDLKRDHFCFWIHLETGKPEDVEFLVVTAPESREQTKSFRQYMKEEGIAGGYTPDIISAEHEKLKINGFVLKIETPVSVRFLNQIGIWINLNALHLVKKRVLTDEDYLQIMFGESLQTLAKPSVSGKHHKERKEDEGAMKRIKYDDVNQKIRDVFLKLNEKSKNQKTLTDMLDVNNRMVVTLLPANLREVFAHKLIPDGTTVKQRIQSVELLRKYYSQFVEIMNEGKQWQKGLLWDFEQMILEMNDFASNRTVYILYVLFDEIVTSFMIVHEETLVFRLERYTSYYIDFVGGRSEFSKASNLLFEKIESLGMDNKIHYLELQPIRLFLLEFYRDKFGFTLSRRGSDSQRELEDIIDKVTLLPIFPVVHMIKPLSRFVDGNMNPLSSNINFLDGVRLTGNSNVSYEDINKFQRHFEVRENNGAEYRRITVDEFKVLEEESMRDSPEIHKILNYTDPIAETYDGFQYIEITYEKAVCSVKLNVFSTEFGYVAFIFKICVNWEVTGVLNLIKKGVVNLFGAKAIDVYANDTLWIDHFFFAEGFDLMPEFGILRKDIKLKKSEKPWYAYTEELGVNPDKEIVYIDPDLKYFRKQPSIKSEVHDVQMVEKKPEELQVIQTSVPANAMSEERKKEEEPHEIQSSRSKSEMSDVDMETKRTEDDDSGVELEEEETEPQKTQPTTTKSDDIDMETKVTEDDDSPIELEEENADEYDTELEESKMEDTFIYPKPKKEEEAEAEEKEKPKDRAKIPIQPQPVGKIGNSGPDRSKLLENKKVRKALAKRKKRYIIQKELDRLEVPYYARSKDFPDFGVKSRDKRIDDYLAKKRELDMQYTELKTEYWNKLGWPKKRKERKKPKILKLNIPMIRNVTPETEETKAEIRKIMNSTEDERKAIFEEQKRKDDELDAQLKALVNEY